MSSVPSRSPEPLPPPPPSQPIGPGVDSAAVKERYLAAARELTAVDDKLAFFVIGVVVWALAAVMALTLVLLPLAVRLLRGWRKVTRDLPDPSDVIAFAERAVPVMAVPLMVNSILRRPGTGRAPGLFLISFDEREGVDFMAGLAMRVGTADPRTMTPAEHAFCRGLMADEEYRADRRRRLPPGLTGDVAVYAVDLMVRPLLLAGRRIRDEMPLVPCMAEPADDGRIVEMPYWLVTNDPPPGTDEKNAFSQSFFSITRKAATRAPTAPSRG